MKKRVLYRDVAAIGIIFFVILAFFFRLFYPKPQIITTPDFGESDAIGNISAKWIYSISLKDNRIPLWSSMIGGGYPIYATGMILGAWYLPNLIAFKLFPVITAYNLMLMGSLMLLGGGTYVWLRILRYPSPIALFGALTLSLSGYCIAQLTHISMIQSASLFPIICILTIWLQKKKSWIQVGWLALVIAEQLFIGSPQMVFITLLFVGATLVYMARYDTNKIVILTKFVIACVLALGIASVQLLPSVEYQSKLNAAQGFSLAQATYFSFPFIHLLTLINPFALGNPKFGTYPPFTAFDGSIFWENTIAIGIAPLIIVLLGIISLIPKKRHDKKRKQLPTGFLWRIMLIILFVSFLLMMGKYSPLYLVFSFWPFSLFRAPSRFVWPFIVSLTVLCSEALYRLSYTYVSPNNRKASIITALFTQIIIIFAFWYSYHALVPAKSWLTPPTLLPYVTRDENVLSIGAEELHNKTFLSKGWQSMSDYLVYRNTFTTDTATLWGVQQFRDYVGRQLARNDVVNTMLNQFITQNDKEATVSATGQKLLSLYSIKTITSAKRLTATDLIRRAHLPINASFIDVYDNPEALPMLYLATDIHSGNTVNDAETILASNDFVVGRSVLREHVTSYETSEATPAQVAFTKVRDGVYQAQVTGAPNRSVLVLAQTYYPGWTAYVDGTKQQTFPVNVRQIGAELSGGNHTVQFVYDPASFHRGLWVSGIVLLVTIFLMVFGRFLPL